MRLHGASGVPFIAACKFKTIMQGNCHVQALYDDLATHAARMIEHPSDYQFRIRFMLTLCLEVLDYNTKTHSVSVEHSTLVQIQAACGDYERSHKYGRQLTATQNRLSSPRASGAQQSARPADPRGPVWPRGNTISPVTQGTFGTTPGSRSAHCP